MCFNRTLSRALFACVFFVSLTSGLRAQDAEIPGQWPWTGCVFSPSADALQILYVPLATLCPITDAALRLTIGPGYNNPVFGQLGVVDSLHYPFFRPTPVEWFSAFAPINATVLRASDGDLVLSATSHRFPASIRFGTTTDTPLGAPEQPAEIERMVINGNGNVGIDLPPGTGGLDSASDQVEIGGGMIPTPGYLAPFPGLTIYGGNRFEGTPNALGVPQPVDWRYIALNRDDSHTDSSSARFRRIAPMGSTRIAFAVDSVSSALHFEAEPYSIVRGMGDFSYGIHMQLSSQNGLEMWSDEGPGNPYHHLFDVWRPKHFFSGDSIRNDSGLFFHYTPVYIGYNYDNRNPLNFTDFAHVRPDIGDGKTWMLAINGPMLAKEVFVLDSAWADYVFDPDYKLKSIPDVEKYIETNHHLPGIPSAKEMAKTGVPLGQTEARMMEKIEEQMRYIIQLSKQVEVLKTEVENLKKGKTS